MNGSRIAARLLVAGLAGTLPAIGCKDKPQTTAPQGNGSSAVAKVETGPDLFTRLDMPKVISRSASAEPVVIPQGVIQFDQKIQVCFAAGSAGSDGGNIELIAAPLPEGTDPKTIEPSRLQHHPRDKTMLYRRLQDTDVIKMGQTLCRIDETQVVIQLKALEKTQEAMKLAIVAAQKVVDTQGEVVRKYKEIGKSSSSPIEVASAEANLAMAEKSKADTVRELARIDGDMLITLKKLDMYAVQSPVEGRILKVLKNPGEYVRTGEPIMELQATARFRVEAKIEVAEANRLRPGMPVIVEPARPYSPEPFVSRHRQEVTGVAVTAHPNRPLVVSTSSDSTAIVWDLSSNDKKQTVLPHPSGVGVKCVAVTSSASGSQLAATGGTDGRIRIWDLTNPESISTTPRDEYEEAHGVPITSLAFSPNGEFLSSAAGREVYVWDIASKKKKYALPADHRDDVTSIRFTPQCTLMTVCRDRTIRMYKLGTQAADIERSLEHRAGNVDQLGLTSDGSMTMFDQEGGRVDVVSLADNRTVGTLLNGNQRFAGLALFSPDDTLALTTAGDADTKGELQLWEIKQKLPDNSYEIRARASERRRLVTPGRSPVTSAAFSPDGKYIVVGTQSGNVYYWMRNSAIGENTELRGVIVTITELDSRSSQVRVEVENKNNADWLQDRGTATIIVDPDAKPVAVPEPKKLPLPKAGGPVAPMPIKPLESLVTPAVPDIQLTGGVIKPVKESSFVVPAMRIPLSADLNPLLGTLLKPKPEK